MCHSQALTSPGCGTSQRSTGRETQESEGPWRGEPLQNLRHMPAGGREGHQPSLPANTRCWEPAQSSPGTQGCLGTAGQHSSCHHPWMTPSFLFSSPLLAGLRAPAPGGLPAPRCRCRAEPRHINGAGPTAAPALGPAPARGSRASLSGHTGGPWGCQGQALQGIGLGIYQEPWCAHSGILPCPNFLKHPH